jgi:hypothetical protein
MVIHVYTNPEEKVVETRKKTLETIVVVMVEETDEDK